MSQAVYFLLLPNVPSLDVSGPAGNPAPAGQFTLRYLSPAPQVVCSIGMTLSGLQPLPERLEDGAILVLLASAIRSAISPERRPGRRAAGWRRCGPICSGSASPWCASVPARCWRRRPGCSTAISAPPTTTLSERNRRQAAAAQVKENRIFVEDRGVYTSCGHHHRHRFGAAPGPPPLRLRPGARRRTRHGGYFRRAGDDPQLSPWLRYRNHLHPAVHRAQDVMAAEPEADWSVLQVAEKATSAAAIWRGCFGSHVGISVREYRSELRLAVAQQRLQQGYGLGKAALAAGFLPGGSCAALSSASARRYDTSRRVSSRCRPTDSSRLPPAPHRTPRRYPAAGGR